MVELQRLSVTSYVYCPSIFLISFIECYLKIVPIFTQLHTSTLQKMKFIKTTKKFASHLTVEKRASIAMRVKFSVYSKKHMQQIDPNKLREQNALILVLK